MSDDANRMTEVKRRQKRVFILGFCAAGVPIILQILSAFVVWTTPDGFPKADNTVFGVGFWCVQVMLLCVAVAGNTIIDFGEHIVSHPAKSIEFVSQFFVVCIFFLAESVLFAVTVLDAHLSWKILTPMLMFGVVDLFAAYRVDMEIALAERG